MCTTCGPVSMEARREHQVSQNWSYSCKSPDVGAEKRTRILCESSMCFEPRAPPNSLHTVKSIVLNTPEEFSTKAPASYCQLLLISLPSCSRDQRFSWVWLSVLHCVRWGLGFPVHHNFIECARCTRPRDEVGKNKVLLLWSR